MSILDQTTTANLSSRLRIFCIGFLSIGMLTGSSAKADTGCESDSIAVADTSGSETMFNPVIQSYNEATDQILETSLFVVEDMWYILKAPTRVEKKDAVWLGGITAGLITVAIYDQDLLDWHLKNNDKGIYKEILDLGYWLEPAGLTRNTHPYYGAAYLAGYLLGIDRLQEIGLQLLESMLFEGNTRVGILNPLVGRSRPWNDRGPYYFKFNDDRSFPSGHTSNIFQLATILSHHVDHWAFTLSAYGLASTVALQRADIKAHWPSDIVFGALYGTAIARGVIAAHESRKLSIRPHISSRNGTMMLGVRYEFQP